MQSLIGRTLRLTAGICARDPRQLLPQLLGRLMACDATRPHRRFLQPRASALIRPAILTQRPSLTPPGAETARLEGHARRGHGAGVLPDGRLASGSDDNTIRLWDVDDAAPRPPASKGTPARSGAGGAARRPPRLGLGDDGTIRLWDVDDAAPRPPASKGTRGWVTRAVRAAGRPARLGLR